MRDGGTPPSANAGTPLRLVCFELREQELALPIGDVRETLTLRPITRVFLTPACLAGIFSLRGDIVPVVDLGILLGLAATVPGDDSRIVVLERGGKVAGVVVDRLRELRTIDDALEPPPPTVAADVAGLLLGVAATPTGTVRVLDLDAILGCEPMRALAASGSDSTSTEGRPA
jgi:purine-binding chemotaxis protein CheW